MGKKRMIAVTAQYRRNHWIVLRAANHRCHYCGNAAYTADHIAPRAHGGTDDVENLVPACSVCNEERSTMCHKKFKRHVRRFGRPVKGWSKKTNRYAMVAMDRMMTSGVDLPKFMEVAVPKFGDVLVDRYLTIRARSSHVN